MNDVIRYTAPASLYATYDFGDELFLDLLGTDWVVVNHDLQFGLVMERYVRQLVYDVSEFCNYLHRPRTIYDDQALQRNLNWYLWKLKRRKYKLARRTVRIKIDDEEKQLLQIIILPRDYPSFMADCCEFDVSTQVLFPLVTM